MGHSTTLRLQFIKFGVFLVQYFVFRFKVVLKVTSFVPVDVCFLDGFLFWDRLFNFAA
jgi:hypothetical protein